MARSFFTRELVNILGVRIHRLHALVNSGKLRPEVHSGRSVWSADQALAAAKMLDVDTPQVRNAITGNESDKTQ